MASYVFDPTYIGSPIRPIFLVLLQSTYAARAWPACRSQFTSEEGLATPVEWVFACSDDWTWLIVTNAAEWHFIAIEWVKNEQEPHLYGYLAAREIHPGIPHVPVVAEALVQTSHREIIRNFRKDLCSLVLASGPDALINLLPPTSGQNDGNAAHRQPAGVQQRHLEVQAMQRLLHGHPLLQIYLDRLAQLHKKQTANAKRQVAHKPKNVDSDASESPSSASSIEDAKGSALTFACLDTLDDKNRQ